MVHCEKEVDNPVLSHFLPRSGACHSCSLFIGKSKQHGLMVVMRGRVRVSSNPVLGQEGEVSSAVFSTSMNPCYAKLGS